jgi:hypothetical protein
MCDRSKNPRAHRRRYAAAISDLERVGDPPAAVSAPPPPRRASAAANRIARLLLLFAVCTAAATPVIAYEVHRNPRLSPIDELAYIDYLHKVGHGHFVIGSGETISGEARHDSLCRGVSRGIRAPDPVGCAAPDPPAAGRTSTEIDAPTYYVLTYVAARGIQGLGFTDDLVQAGRLAGALWAGASLALLVLLCRDLGASRAASAAAAAACLATPGLVTPLHFVTPHATNLLVGALVTLLVLRWDRGAAGGWALVLAGILPPLVKAPQVVAPLAMATFLLVGAVWGGGGRLRFDRRRLIGSATVVASLAAGTGVWLMVRRHYAHTSEPPFPQLNVASFEPHFLLDNVAMFVRSWSGGPAAGMTLLVVLWCYGSAVGYLANSAYDETLRRLSGALLAVAVTGAVIFVVSNYILLGQYYSIPERYGFSLVPAALALGAVNLRTRTSLACAGLVVVALLALVQAYPTQG